MKHRLKMGDTFCVLPWISNFQNLDGNHYLCCISKTPIDSDQNKNAELRRKIWMGEKVNHCETCYKLEANKVLSSRQIESVKWLADTDVAQLFSTDNVPEVAPFHYDIRLDNKCNLSCIGCSPHASTLWAKELGTQLKYTNELITVDLTLAKHIYLAGGEPLIIDKYLQLIHRIGIENPKIELVINTNLTNIDDKIIDLLSQVTNVSLVVSVDSYGLVNSYHRYPLSWDKFLRNLEKVKNNKIKVMFNTVASAVSVFGWNQLYLLDEYADKWNISIIHTPSSLLLENIPVQLKSLAVKNILAMKQSKFYKFDVVFKNHIDHCIEKTKLVGNSNLLSEYISELDQRRKIDHEMYLGVRLNA